jgi:SPP1 family phage portal protein
MDNSVLYYNDYSLFSQRLTLDIESGQGPSVALLKEIILLHYNDRQKMMKLFSRYSAKKNGAPIRSRLIKTEGKPNNQIENNFFKKIVNTKTGYYASKIDYQLDKNDFMVETIDENGEEKETLDPIYSEYNDVLQDFLIRNSAKKLDSTIAKMAGICGYAVKNVFINNLELYMQSVNPWECIFISDTELPKYCVRYYTIIDITAAGLIPTIKIDFYDDKMIYSYQEVGTINNGGSFQFLESKPHLLQGLPMIQYKNNAELSPDCDDSVMSLIDAYDICVSDGVNEIDGLAQAYLVLVNMVLGNDSAEAKETLEAMKQSGVIQIGDNGQAFFITKNINDTFFENVINRLEKNIYQFASSVNLNDENFAANTSGVAMKYKLLALETVSIISENEFKSATLETFKIASNYWNLRGIPINYLDIYINMKRNFPLDILAEAQANAQLKGLVSENTRISQLSFVDDVNYEIEQMKQDEERSSNPYDMTALPGIMPELPVIDETAAPVEGE